MQYTANSLVVDLDFAKMRLPDEDTVKTLSSRVIIVTFPEPPLITLKPPARAFAA